MQRKAPLSLLVLGVTIVLAGCGPEVADAEVPVERVPHRVAPCEQLCEQILDAECGSSTPPRAPGSLDLDTCVDQCANSDAGWHWGPQPDGTDICAGEWSDYLSCIAQLSCEEQLAHWNTNRTLDYPCKREETTHVLCGHDNPPPQEGE